MIFQVSWLQSIEYLDLSYKNILTKYSFQYIQGWIMTFWGPDANEILIPASERTTTPAPVLNIFTHDIF